MTQVHFTYLTRESLELVFEWLHEPHVVRWWGAPPSRVDFEQKYVPRLEGAGPTRVYLFQVGDSPLGLIQWYRLRDYPDDAARCSALNGDAGVDLFIGNPEQVGRGIGSRALNEFVADIVFANDDISACIADPDMSNEASIRAFQRAGFEIDSVVPKNDGTGTCALMRRNRNA